MATLSESMAFEWPAETVWEYLIAFEQVPLWEGGVLEVRQPTPGEPVIGTQIAARRVYGGVETALTGTIVEYEPGRQATMELSGGPLRATRVRYAVEPTTATTSVVTFSATVDLRGPMRLLTPLVPLMGRRQTRQNLARLRRRIAAGIPPRSDLPTPSGT